jgi:hypothetical protein
MQTINSNIPSSVYSGGNVRFDSTPFTKYYLETQARNQAKDEAFIKSFQNMAASVTPAGMDSKDVPAFMKMKQDWINDIIQNKKKYENPSLDNGEAYGRAMTKYNQMLTHAEASKDKLKRIAPLQSIFSNPEKRKVMTEQFMNDYHSGTLPVDNPNYRPFDMASVDFNPKPFEQKDLLALDNNIKSLIAPSLKNKIYGEARIDKATNSKYTPYTVQLKDSDYKNIRANAALLSGTNPSFATLLDNELNNPDDYDTLNQVYKSHFGKDANISNREDMATALFLSRVSPDLSGEEKSNYTDVLGNFYAEQAQRMNDFYKREQYKQDNPTAEKSTWVQDMADAANNGDVEQLKNTASQLFAANPNYVKLKGTPHVKDNTLYFDYQENEFDAKGGEKDASGKPKGGYVWKDKVMTLPLDKVNIPETKAKMAAFQQKFLGTSQKVKNAPYYKVSTNQQSAPKKTIKKSDIAAKATAAGYTVKEYQDLLIKNGIKIID